MISLPISPHPFLPALNIDRGASGMRGAQALGCRQNEKEKEKGGKENGKRKRKGGGGKKDLQFYSKVLNLVIQAW